MRWLLVIVVLAGQASADPDADRALRRGRDLYARGDLEHASEALAELVDRHPEHPDAPAAAELLLDCLDHQNQHEAMLQWVEKMRASRRLLEHRPELASLLMTLHVDGVRARAELQEREGERGHRDSFLRCAATYLDVFAAEPAYAQRDELLYNAACCLEAGGEHAQAIRRFGEVVKSFPRSSLAEAARRRASKISPQRE